MKQEELRELQPLLFERFCHLIRESRLAHAYLFSGDFASFEMALFVSQSLFCLDKQEKLPCGHCRNCRLIEAEEFSDVTVIAPQGMTIKTETIRELVKGFSQSGFEGKQQVFIVREVEKMHPNAANSLLKAMEEPQSETYLFLLTAQEEAVLETIKSRAQIVTFSKNTAILERELDKLGLLKTQTRVLAQITNNLAEAQQLAGRKAFVEMLAVARKWLEELEKSSARAYLELGFFQRFATEKADQERVFEVLTVLLAEKIEQPWHRKALQQLLLARKMWLSNVNFQNSLEYWVLTLSNK